jgi:glycosyltransferase involved in cell wall biosynthesis
MPFSPPASVALIIPALNEEPVIGAMLSSLPPGLFQTVIVADNGSTDRTAEIALSHGATVVHEPERGYGAACLKAIAQLPPETAAVVFMQADCSENPAEAHLLLDPISDGRADLVIGALLPHQEFGNRVATTLIRWLYGHNYTDLGPFRAIRTSSLTKLQMADRNYGWTVEMQVKALQHGLRVLELPVSYRLRKAGVNKVSGNWKASLRAGWIIIRTIFRLHFRAR